MDAELARAFLLALPHAVETMQWGDRVVFWVGDKALGGKMFCVLNLEAGANRVLSYAAGPERYAELVEREGFMPAPYVARIYWVAVERWTALRHAEWEGELRAAHSITLAKLPKRTRDLLALTEREQTKLIAERRKLLAKRHAEKIAAVPPKRQGKRSRAS